MQLTKLKPTNQVFLTRKRLKQTKLLLKHLTNQLTDLRDDQMIKLKLRQIEALNYQRIALENRLEGLR